MFDNKAELLAELEKVRAENSTLKADAKRSLKLKVSEKGAVSIYGVGRFPVTLYKSQIDLVFSDEFIAQLRTFVKENETRLAIKGATPKAVAA